MPNTRTDSARRRFAGGVLAVACCLGLAASAPAVGEPPGVPPAAWPAPPVASARDAVDISQHGAELHAHLDANGVPITYYFEYGRDTSYGQRSASRTDTSPLVSAFTNVYARVRRLRLGTTYHYRLVATNPAGTDRSGDSVFTTYGRLKPYSVSLRVSPRRDRTAPYRFGFSGRVGLPVEVARADACTGVVRVMIRDRGRLVAVLRPRLSSTCTYQTTSTVKGRHCALSAQTRVENGALLPGHSPAVRFRSG